MSSGSKNDLMKNRIHFDFLWTSRWFLICCWAQNVLLAVVIILHMVSRRVSLMKKWSSWQTVSYSHHFCLHTLFTFLSEFQPSPTPLNSLAQLWINLSRCCFPETFTQMLPDKIQYPTGVGSIYENLLQCRKPSLWWWNSRQRTLSYILGTGSIDHLLFSFLSSGLFPQGVREPTNNSVLRNLADSRSSSSGKSDLHSMALY